MNWLTGQDKIPADSAQTRSSLNAMAGGWEGKLAWLSVGHPKNPFKIEVLDCRPLALHFQSFTTIPAVAETFNRLRASDGLHLIGQRPDHAVISDTSLQYPFHGKTDPGPIYRAKKMEDRWDISRMAMKFT